MWRVLFSIILNNFVFSYNKNLTFDFGCLQSSSVLSYYEYIKCLIGAAKSEGIHIFLGGVHFVLHKEYKGAYVVDQLNPRNIKF